MKIWGKKLITTIIKVLTNGTDSTLVLPVSQRTPCEQYHILSLGDSVDKQLFNK